MASFEFPTAPAFEDAIISSPPAFKEGQEQKFMEEVDLYMSEIFQTFNDLSVSIQNGWLIKDARVVSLEAETVFADSIITEDLSVGSDENLKILGSLDLFRVKDGNGTTRVRIGKLGTSTADQWGIEVADSGGSVIFQSTDVTTLDGAIIDDATITNAKILDGTIGGVKIQDLAITNQKLDDLAVTDAKINDLSASKIDAGKLTADGSPVSIEVTGAGAFLASDGGDIILRRNLADHNIIVFQDTDSSTIGTITASSNLYRLEHNDGAKLSFLGGGDVQLEAATNTNVVQIFGEVDIVDDLQIPTNQASSPASGSMRWNGVNDTIEVYNGTSWVATAQLT